MKIREGKDAMSHLTVLQATNENGAAPRLIYIVV